MRREVAGFFTWRYVPCARADRLSYFMSQLQEQEYGVLPITSLDDMAVTDRNLSEQYFAVIRQTAVF